MKIHVEKSITINKPASHVYSVLSDLKQWNIWSPWMHCEPTAKTENTGSAQQVGQTQTWDGEVIGSGKMTIESLDPNKSMGMKLEFFKPWKSVADVKFSISEAGGQSTVNWAMDSQLPIFMFFFKKMMVAFMGADFDRGLKMLKEHCETGELATKSSYKGTKNQNSFTVVGKKTTCALKDLASVMQSDFEQLGKLMKNDQLSEPDKMLSVYHKFDIPNGVCEYTAGFLYNNDQKIKYPAHFDLHKIPSHNSIAVDHYGAYRHLGNPWSMAMTYQRCKKMKMRKDISMYEIYVTMPDGRAEKDIYTQIYVPVK